MRKLPTFATDVLVVVFGVLLALSIDQFKTQLDDDKLERDYLSPFVPTYNTI